MTRQLVIKIQLKQLRRKPNKNPSRRSERDQTASFKISNSKQLQTECKLQQLLKNIYTCPNCSSVGCLKCVVSAPLDFYQRSELILRPLARIGCVTRIFSGIHYKWTLVNRGSTIRVLKSHFPALFYARIPIPSHFLRDFLLDY